MPYNALKIEYRKICDLKHYANNPRVHNRAQRRKLNSLLLKFGQVAPVIIDPNGVIIDGHAVVEGLEALGFDEVATVTVTGHSREEIRALRLALNRIPQDARWDQHNLRIEFQELIDLGFDMDLTAFDQVEIDMSLSFDEPASGEIEDVPAAPDLEGEAISRLGDLWSLGNHRLICADARDVTALKSLFISSVARMMFADPPYHIRIDKNVSGSGRTKHREFEMFCGDEPEEEFNSFLLEFLDGTKTVMRDGGIGFICMDWRHIANLVFAGKEAGLGLKNIIVWVKTNAGMGAFYRSQHELLAAFKWGDEPHLHNFELGKKGKSRSNVWTYAGMNSFGTERDELFAKHPTVKPLALVKDAIKDVSRRGDIVFDPFLGSGTTLIAAEETGRRCFGVELDPLYVDLSIRRWQDATGKQAIHAATGLTFDEMEVTRTSEVALLPPPSNQTEEG